MNLQKRLASKILKCGPSRVTFDETQLDKIKEAITRFDVKKLIGQGIITRKGVIGTARGKAQDRKFQKRKGRHRGPGSRKGTANARTNTKDAWVARARVQRALLRRMFDGGHIEKPIYKNMYQKVKGGFFRSSRHIKIYLEENNLLRKQSQ